MRKSFFLLFVFLLLYILPVFSQQTIPQQTVIILMLDGFGPDYYKASKMPVLNRLEYEGMFKIVPGLMPSVTNTNNASICTGVLPSVNGITGNSYYNEEKKEEAFMEEASLLLAPTIFERAQKFGVKSALFSAKKKTTGLLSKGTSLSLSPEEAPAVWIQRLGEPPSIYSGEVNYWLMEAALYTMRHDTSIHLYYIHTTDYPMHTWAPEDTASLAHLNKIDNYIGQLLAAAPGAMVLITADHTVHHKSLCVDIEKACAQKGLSIKMAVSAERDKYVKHHRGFGGVSYVYLNDNKDLATAIKIARGLKGVEGVLTRQEAAKQFNLLPSRIGDLVVLGDINTVFGNIDSASEALPPGYRSHGSLHEAVVPLFVYNAQHAPAPAFFSSNYKIASWLW